MKTHLPLNVLKKKKLRFEEVLNTSRVFDKLFDPFCIVAPDEKETILYANKAFTEFAQIAKKDIDNSNASFNQLKLKTEEGENPIELCKASLKNTNLREISGQFSDGSQISVQLSLQPLFDEKEKSISGILVNFQDKSLELKLHLKHKEMIEKIEEDFDESSRVFTSILELTDPANLHASRVANLSKNIAVHMGLEGKQVKHVEIAAQLHDIGKLGMNQELREKKKSQMSELEAKEYKKHPILGALLFEGIDSFSEICSFIKTHHEDYDGGGFPNGNTGEQTPIGGYIIGLANDYCHMVDEDHEDDEVTIQKTMNVIQAKQNLRYHPRVVNALQNVIDSKSNFVQTMFRKEIGLEELKRGMTLSKELRTSKGVLLIHAEERVSTAALERIRSFHENDPITCKIEIYSKADKEEMERRKLASEDKAMYKVLVADDTADLNFLICTILKKTKVYEAKGVHDGNEALKELQNDKYDCILLDMMMPGLDGLSTLEKVRAMNIQTPVIMCTAKNDGESIVKAFKLGANDYIVKPVLKDILLEMLQKVLNSDSQKEDFSQVSPERRQNMIRILQDHAPEFLLHKAERRQNQLVHIYMQLIDDNQKIDSDQKYEVTGSAESINKNGLHVKTECKLELQNKFSFKLQKENEKKPLLHGIGIILKELRSGKPGKEDFIYQMQFLSLKK